MTSHRTPKTTTRTAAVTMVGLTAGAVALVPAQGYAAPAQTYDQVKAEVQSLNTQSEAATQTYDAAQAQYAQLQQSINALQGQITTQTGELRVLQKSMGVQAAVQYETNTVSPAVQLAMTTSPDAFLAKAAEAQETSVQDAARLKQLTAAEATLRQDQARASALLTEQQTTLHQLASGKATIQSELSQAQALLHTLTAAQQATIENNGNSSAPTTTNVPLPPVSGRAAAAVAYAKSKLGDQYVYAATGPLQFDCSGLTQAAWRAAGVSIERDSYQQWTSLPHVSIADLQPGDLLFYEPNSQGPGHVAIYVGNGMYIHAPHPGTVVQYGSMAGAGMPYVGAARP